MPRIVKKLLIIFAIVIIVGLGLWIGLRPWWLGSEIIRRTGNIQNISFVERPLCKYWQGELRSEEPNHPIESLTFWIDPTQSNLIEKLDHFSKTGEKVEVQYQKDRAKRFWACTPSDYKVISIDPILPNPVPTK